MSNDEKDPMKIINDPKNYISREESIDGKKNSEENTTNPEEKTEGMSRRDFLRFGGAAAAVGTVAASGAIGFATGRDPAAATGWGRTFEGADMFFNREPFRTDVANMMTPVGEVTRAHWTDGLFERRNSVLALLRSKQWDFSMGVEAMPGQIGDYYRKHPERYQAVIEQFEMSAREADAWNNGNGFEQYALASAYSTAHRMAYSSTATKIDEETGQTKTIRLSSVVEDPHCVYVETGVEQPPEKWDYRNIPKDPKKRLKFKSPAHATKLIKKMSHLFGASVVGITKFNPDFMFTDIMRGMKNRGQGSWGDKVPSHWKSIIILAIPMHWDQMHTSHGYSTATDGYFRGRCTAGLLENFIQTIGYPARAQANGTTPCFEIMITPFVMQSGLGEYSRGGYAMIPEIGGNFRSSAVITDIEFEYDKPIDIGMAKFCMKCKICADACPSGSLPKDDTPQTVVRGFRRWKLEEESCYKQWLATPVSACGVCVSVCPYTRKNTWIHAISRELEPRDPVGIVATGLLTMQQNFFHYPTAEEFLPTWDGGQAATYHNPPWWARSEDFFDDIEKTWEYRGMN